jgi:hypothetical protein
VSGLASKPFIWFSLVWPQNQWRRFVSSLASKPVAMVFRWFGLKTSGDGFLQFGLKTGGDGFSQFGLKTGVGFLG